MGIKVKGDVATKQTEVLQPIQYDILVGILRAEIKSLDALADAALPLEDLSQTEEGPGFDEAADHVLEVIETKIRSMVPYIAELRQKINHRPKAMAGQMSEAFADEKA